MQNILGQKTPKTDQFLSRLGFAQAPSPQPQSLQQQSQPSSRSSFSGHHLYTSSNPENFIGLENAFQNLDLHHRVMTLTEQTSTLPTRGCHDSHQIKGVLGGLQSHETPKQLISGKRPKVSAGATADMNELIGGYQQKNKMQVWDNLEKQQLPFQIIEQSAAAAKQLKMAENWARMQESISIETSGNRAGSTTIETSDVQSSTYGMVQESEKRAGRVPPSKHHQQSQEQKGAHKRAHFFDSKSKYVTLKSDSQEKFLIINKWYRSLSLSDKAVALTIVDKDLVQLFKSMYRTEHTHGLSGGKFSTQVADCQDMHDQSQLCQVPQYNKNLVYIKQMEKLRNIHSSTLREKEGALGELVEHVRIISVRQPNDAITIDVELISNIDYFMKIMKLVDEEFLIREYKLTKETSVTGSLLFSKEDTEGSTKSRQYFHVADPQKQVYPATHGTISGISNFGMQSRQQSLQQSYVTLAKCILLSFEKCLNVHFQEHQKKLSQLQNQQFFLKDSEITTNPFTEDNKLATWWHGLNQDQKKTHLEAAKDMEREIVLQHNSLKFETVNESDDEQSADDWVSNAKQGLQQIQCESTSNVIQEQQQQQHYNKQRRKRKDRKHHTLDGSDRTSSSGLQNTGSSSLVSMNPYYNDYNQKQLRMQYGDDNSEDDYDLESQQKPAQVQNNQSQLFLNIDNSMYKCRQNLVSTALQTQDMPQCLMFVKQLSLWKSFENSLRENALGEITPKYLTDVKRILHKKYYEYLEEAFQKSVLDDLLIDEELTEEPSKNKKKNKKKNRRNKNKKAEESAQPTLAQPQALAQKPVTVVAPTTQIKEASPAKSTSIEMLGRQLGLDNSQMAALGGSPAAQPKPVPIMELPKIQINFDIIKLQDENDTRQPTPTSSDASSASISKAMEAVTNIFKSQDDQLMVMARKIEKISTCEKMLNEGVLEKGGAGSEFLKSLLKDSSDDEYSADLRDIDQLSQHTSDLLKSSQFWHQKKTVAQIQGRYEEERTGLLSNMVHHDKYTNQQEYLEDHLVNKEAREKQDQLKYLLEADKMTKYSINRDFTTTGGPGTQEVTLSEPDSDEEQILQMRMQIQDPAFNKMFESVKQAPATPPKQEPAKPVEESKTAAASGEQPPKKKKKNKSRRNKKGALQQQSQLKDEQAPTLDATSTTATKIADGPSPQESLIVAESIKPLVVAEIDSLPQPIETVVASQEVDPKPVELLNVRKNNFFDDDSSSMSSSNQGSIIYLKDAKDLSLSRDRKQMVNEVSKKMAQRIVKNASLNQPKVAVQSGQQQQPQPAQSQSKKKGKNKQNAQTSAKQQPIEPPPSIFSFLASPSRAGAQLGKAPTPTSLQFDPDVKIPSRGKASTQSKDCNMRDEMEHQRTMQELDSLFHSSSNDHKSFSSGKLRSSTVEASRGALVVSQFDLDELEDDAMSVNVNVVQKKKTVLDREQSQQEKQNKLAAEKAIKSLQLIPPPTQSTQAAASSLMKAQKPLIQKQNKMPDLMPVPKPASSTVVAEDPPSAQDLNDSSQKCSSTSEVVVVVEQPGQKAEEPAAPASQSKPVQPVAAQTPQQPQSQNRREQPQTASFSKHQQSSQGSQQPSYTKKQSQQQQPSRGSGAQPQPSNTNNSKQTQPSKSAKPSSQTSQPSQQIKQFKAKPTQQNQQQHQPVQPAQQPLQSQPLQKPQKTFASYDSMFQNIYGAGATSATPPTPSSLTETNKQVTVTTAAVTVTAAVEKEPTLTQSQQILKEAQYSNSNHSSAQACKTQQMVSSSFSTSAHSDNNEMLAKSYSASTSIQVCSSSSEVVSLENTTTTTHSPASGQQRTQKLSKKQQKKMVSLQEHGAMVTPSYFQQTTTQMQQITQEKSVVAQGLPSNYVDSSFQTDSVFTPSSQSLPLAATEFHTSCQQSSVHQQQQPQKIQERGVSFPHFYVNQQNHTTLNLNIFQQQPTQQQQQPFMHQQYYNPFQPQQMPGHTLQQQQQQQQQINQNSQMQMPYHQSMFPNQQASFAPYFHQQLMYPSPHHQQHQQQQQQPMYYSQQQQQMPPSFPHHAKPSYYAQQQQPHSHSQLQPYDIVPLCDQIQLDRRQSYCDQHEKVFHNLLGNQILQVQQKMETLLSEAEEARILCFDLISKVARDTFPELSLSFDVYGSMATKLAIDTSDMDIAIYGIQAEARSQALQQLNTKLQECKSVSYHQLILTASVPVIKLEMSFDKLAQDLKVSAVKIGKIKTIKIDLVMHDQAQNNQMHQTKQCAEFIKKQILEHPFLKPLTIVLKKYLTLKNLNSPFQGTMSSYGLVLLVLTLLKDMSRVIPHLEFQQTPQYFATCLGRVFTHLFMVYGDPQLFNESTITNGSLQFELSTGEDTVFNTNAQGTRSLVIQDPIDAQNNVGKQIYNFFSNVQEQLNVTQRVLLIRFKEWQVKLAEQEALEIDKRATLHNQARASAHNNSSKANDHKTESLTSQIQEQIDALGCEIAAKQNELLDRIIMVNMSDLSCIYRDEVEERQKNLLQATKQMANILQPFENRQSFNTQLQKLFFHPMQLGMMTGGGPLQQQQQPETAFISPLMQGPFMNDQGMMMEHLMSKDFTSSGAPKQ